MIFSGRQGESIRLLMLLLFIVVSTGLRSQDPLMDSIAKAFHQTDNFHGSVLVARDGKILLNKGYGYANHALNIQSTAHTIYQIGSITKQFTAAVIMKLEEQGQLNTKDTISKYFPGLKEANRITIHHLLSHRSGLFNYTKDTSYWYGTLNEKKLIDFLNTKPLDFQPGADMQYSNSGYILAGYIIEKITGKEYEEVVRTMIFEPLRMDQSGFDYKNLQSPNKSAGYYDNGTEFIPARSIDSTISYSAGAIYSTTDNLLRWAEAIDKRSFLQSSSWDKIMTNYGKKYGYGMVVDNLLGEKLIWHNGGLDGYSSDFLYFPEKKIVIIAFTNYMQSNLRQLNTALAAALMKKSYRIPTARKEISLPADSLSQYTGVYELAPQFSITVTVDGDKLMAQATGQQNFRIYPYKQDHFFYKIVDAQIEFLKDAGNKVIAMVLYQNGQKIKGIKE